MACTNLKQCPEADARDYGDYPLCNALGLENKKDTYIKSIYRWKTFTRILNKLFKFEIILKTLNL